MTQITDAYNQEVPFLNADVEVQAISGDFDPDNSGSPAVSDKARYLNKGFLVRPDTDGALKVLTWANYVNNDHTVVDANAVVLTGCTTGAWELVRVVKVYETGSDSTNVLIGILP